tara:strand:- start:87 stop:2228 length:2142 start_codon:yes stop_codon:yes gene_type:complete
MIVLDSHAYLINSKQNIIDTGNTYNFLQGKWLFDGEYITKDKDNNPIQIYMIFDVYYSGEFYKGLPQPIHTYPFMGNTPTSIDRHTILYECSVKMFYEMENSEDSILVDIKEYECGYNWGIKPVDFDPQKISDKSLMGIFKASDRILEKERNGEFKYRIDGLIYLPMRFPVRGSSEGSPVKNINGTWEYNYKWKPPEENTIDFQIYTRKETLHKKSKDIIIPLNNSDGELEEYKIVDLMVGYDYKMDHENRNYCMEILEPKKPNLSKIIEFQHKEVSKTNILLTNGKMICENGDEIHDKDLVEMKYVKDSNNDVHWIPLRSRNRDKKEPQFFITANNIWNTIIDPITNDMILNGEINREKIIKEDDGKYYVNNENTFSESISLRKLHNYIKSKLIKGICSSMNGKFNVLDLSIGRGGDIQKYSTKDCKFIFGIDISTNVDEACKRYFNLKQPKPLGVFIRGNTSKNILSKECVQIEDIKENERVHSETMISILYGNNDRIPKEYNNISKKYKGLAKNNFNIISSQFSMHYYFQTEETFNGFIQNLNENIQSGGYFIGTCYDGERLFNKLQKSNMEMYDSTGNLIYRVEQKYDIDNFTYTKDSLDNMFGNEIMVYMDSIGQSIPEYLVNFEFFIDIMKENGFELVIPQTNNKIFTKKYFENTMGNFGNVIDNLIDIKQTDKEFRSYFSEAYDILNKKELIELSSLNNYFIFQKV